MSESKRRAEHMAIATFSLRNQLGLTYDWCVGRYEISPSIPEAIEVLEQMLKDKLVHK